MKVAQGRKYLQLGRDILDHQIVDKNGTYCGKVDDIELDLSRKEPQVKAILIGAGVWNNRVPRFIRPLTRKVFTKKTVTKIPLTEIDEVSFDITLKKVATSYNLNIIGTKIAKLIERVPFS